MDYFSIILYTQDGDTVFCRVDGEDMNRIVSIDYKNKSVILKSTCKWIKDIHVTPETECIINGVITYSVTPHIPARFYPNSERANTIDLNKLVVKNKADSFFGFIDGNSMIESYIIDKDLAVIDKSIPYINGFKALCRIRDKHTIKFLQWDKKDKGVLWLMPANKDFPPIQVNSSDNSVVVIGVVAFTITPHNRSFPNL